MHLKQRGGAPRVAVEAGEERVGNHGGRCGLQRLRRAEGRKRGFNLRLIGERKTQHMMTVGAGRLPRHDLPRELFRFRGLAGFQQRVRQIGGRHPVLWFKRQRRAQIADGLFAPVHQAIQRAQIVQRGGVPGRLLQHRLPAGDRLIPPPEIFQHHAEGVPGVEVGWVERERAAIKPFGDVRRAGFELQSRETAQRGEIVRQQRQRLPMEGHRLGGAALRGQQIGEPRGRRAHLRGPDQRLAPGLLGRLQLPLPGVQIAEVEPDFGRYALHRYRALKTAEGLGGPAGLLEGGRQIDQRAGVRGRRLQDRLVAGNRDRKLAPPVCGHRRIERLLGRHAPVS